MATEEQTKKRILRVATKTAHTGRELAAKLNKNHPGEGYRDARSFGRSLGALVASGDLIKDPPKSRPRSRKP